MFPNEWVRPAVPQLEQGEKSLQRKRIKQVQHLQWAENLFYARDLVF